jgi:hypothetical protein
MTKTAIRHHYTRLRATRPAFSGSINRAVKLRRQRDQNPPTADALADPTRRRLTAIPPGPQSSARAAAAARAKHPRRQNWDRVCPTTSLQDREARAVTISHGRYSGRCRYERLSYRPATRSAGTITPRRLFWVFADNAGMIRAGRGWMFGQDSVGLYVQRAKSRRIEDRYHFAIDDCASWRTLRAAAVRHCEEQRRVRESAKAAAAAAAAAEQQARDLGILVAWHDNRMAGNCAAGSLTWCQQHGVDPRRPVRIEILERLQDTHHAVRRACRQAIRRAIAELRAGVGSVMPAHFAREVFAR